MPPKKKKTFAPNAPELRDLGPLSDDESLMPSELHRRQRKYRVTDTQHSSRRPRFLQRTDSYDLESEDELTPDDSASNADRPLYRRHMAQHGHLGASTTHDDSNPNPELEDENRATLNIPKPPIQNNTKNTKPPTENKSLWPKVKDKLSFLGDIWGRPENKYLTPKQKEEKEVEEISILLCASILFVGLSIFVPYVPTSYIPLFLIGVATISIGGAYVAVKFAASMWSNRNHTPPPKVNVSTEPEVAATKTPELEIATEPEIAASEQPSATEQTKEDRFLKELRKSLPPRFEGDLPDHDHTMLQGGEIPHGRSIEVEGDGASDLSNDITPDRPAEKHLASGSGKTRASGGNGKSM